MSTRALLEKAVLMGVRAVGEWATKARRAPAELEAARDLIRALEQRVEALEADLEYVKRDRDRLAELGLGEGPALRGKVASLEARVAILLAELANARGGVDDAQGG